jgi:hypothetical protein
VTVQVLDVDAASYRAHPLHTSDRIWLETNCYVDLWIELLHCMQLDPVASMAFALAMDFEGDQWTFFKPPHADLYRLYGVDVQELAIWRPVQQHVIEQLKLGRVPLVEVDAFYLPDTAGVSYGIEHTKTTIAVQSVDRSARRMGYFHNAGYFILAGDDFEGLFGAFSSSLPPYTEIAKLDHVVRRDRDELAGLAGDLMRQHVRRMPDSNPATKYRQRYGSDIEWLASEDMSTFYKYAFATLRQCGAAAEMAATFLRWLPDTDSAACGAAADFEGIATAAKAVQFKIARTMATRKAADVTPLLEQMEAGWDRARTALAAHNAA